ncbi:MAG: hypothetical protein IT292_10685 [Deltaproteobacteria bacterium]|nr:hypothetical protein [Deltaproteobacteria bacterium]
MKLFNKTVLMATALGTVCLGAFASNTSAEKVCVNSSGVLYYRSTTACPSGQRDVTASIIGQTGSTGATGLIDPSG